MIRSRSATFTLALLALAPGCSSQSSAPGSAHGSANVQPVSSDRAAPESREEEPAAASPEEADLDDAAQPVAAPRGASMKAKESAPSRLTIAEPMTSGGLDRDIIRRKAQDHAADIEACTDGLDGSVAVKFEVDARGVVKDVELGGDSTVDDRAVIDCILALVSKWSFAGEAKSKASVELRLELK